jgi:ABC transporter
VAIRRCGSRPAIDARSVGSGTLAGAIHNQLCLPQVHRMTIRAKGKMLLENTDVTITAGRRYGLVGPNGMGKSTLLRLIARRQVRHPSSASAACSCSPMAKRCVVIAPKGSWLPMPICRNSVAVSKPVLKCRDDSHVQVPVPAGLDVLLVEQEVVGTDQSALEVHDPTPDSLMLSVFLELCRACRA